MPRSIGRRVELLEKGAAAVRHQPEAAELLLRWLEAAAGRGFADLPPALASALAPLWAAYVPTRDELLAAPENPPGDYQAHIPRARRVRLWLRFDHPRLRDATNALCETVAGFGRINGETGPESSAEETR